MAELKYNDENFDDDFDDFDDYDDRFHQQMKLTMVLLPYIHRKIWKMLLKCIKFYILLCELFRITEYYMSYWCKCI